MTERLPQTLADVLDQCGGSFTRELVDGEAATELRAACARLPALLTTLWGVESRIGEPHAELDLLMEIKRGSPGHALLAGDPGGRNDAAELAARFPEIDRIATGPTWRSIREFARRWLDPADALHRTVEHIWLEFDLVAAARAGRAQDAIGRPSIFFGPDHVGPDIDAPTSTPTLIRSIAAAFPAFPVDVPFEALERVLGSLPEGARVFSIGAMDRRGDVRLRLCIGCLPPTAIAGWVTSIGWQGDDTALDALLERFGSLVKRVELTLDITGEGLGPKLGFECYQAWGSVNATQWMPMFDMLVSEGLMIGVRRAAVAAFPAVTRFTSREQLRLRDGHYIYPVLVRDVHHIKLGFEGGLATEAKAYFGVYRPGVNMGSSPRQYTPTSRLACEDLPVGLGRLAW